jgi:predicted DNA-binding transcriptional regulator AlpA
MPLAKFRQKYLRNRPAAEYLGVSESFLNKRRVNGEPPAFFKIGKVVIYSLSELDRYLATCHRKSTSDRPNRACNIIRAARVSSTAVS